MDQRSDFERHICDEFGEDYIDKDLNNDYVERVARWSWTSWQAAIQHASDVAAKVCEEISEREHRDFKGLNPDAPPGKRGNSYVEGLSDGADLAADAIKEALK